MSGNIKAFIKWYGREQVLDAKEIRECEEFETALEEWFKQIHGED